MTVSAEPSAVSAKGWSISLVAVLLVCVAAAINAMSGGSTSAAGVGVTAGIAAAYAVLFFVSAPRATPGSRAAWILTVGTIVAAGCMTATVPSNAILQFWAFPMLWALMPSIAAACASTFALALTVFAGFWISTSDEAGWLTTALLTQGISFAVNLVMGLWITSIYAYAHERERLLRELTSVQDEIADLHREAGIRTERERLSREVHDTLAQSLTAAVLLVQRTRRDLHEGKSAEEALDLVEEVTRGALAETRAIVAGSGPVELDRGGIRSAIESLSERFRRETSLEIEIELAVSHPLDREVEVALLRCTQEAFANIRKHSAARRVEVSLATAENETILTVRDDGRGFDPATVRTGYGLPGLRARLAILGGTLDVRGTPGDVHVRARIPREAAA